MGKKKKSWLVKYGWIILVAVIGYLWYHSQQTNGSQIANPAAVWCQRRGYEVAYVDCFEGQSGMGWYRKKAIIIPDESSWELIALNSDCPIGSETAYCRINNQWVEHWKAFCSMGTPGETFNYC